MIQWQQQVLHLLLLPFLFQAHHKITSVAGNGVVEQELQVHVLGTILPQSLDAVQPQTSCGKFGAASKVVTEDI